MSDLIKERVVKSIGKTATVFLVNGWRYKGKITNSDETFLEIVDYKTNSYKLIRFSEIKDCEIEL